MTREVKLSSTRGTSERAYRSGPGAVRLEPRPEDLTEDQRSHMSADELDWMSSITPENRQGFKRRYQIYVSSGRSTCGIMDDPAGEGLPASLPWRRYW